MEEYIIFTDGASRGNPGPGGWGAVIVGAKSKVESGKAQDVQIAEFGGHEEHTTNNRMELKAAIEAIKTTENDSHIVLYTDSSYVINGITKWVKGWKMNDWRTKTKKDVLNKDLWMELDELNAWRTIDWRYTGGHIGVKGNERCDEIATAFADGKKIELYRGSLAGYDIQNILNVEYDKEKHSLKKSASARSNAKAYSYVSKVNGVIQIHHSWAECEKRVKRVRGARFKKSLGAEDEKKIIEEFSLK